MTANVLKDIHAYIRMMCREPVYKNDRIIDGDRMMVKHLFQFLLCLSLNIANYLQVPCIAWANALYSAHV